MTFLFVDGNKRSTEVLDKFEGVTSVFKNVASGILADKPTFDNGSIKLGTDVDVAVMGNDCFDFNSVQLVVASKLRYRAKDIRYPTVVKKTARIVQTLQTQILSHPP